MTSKLYFCTFGIPFTPTDRRNSNKMVISAGRPSGNRRRFQIRPDPKAQAQSDYSLLLCPGGSRRFSRPGLRAFVSFNFELRSLIQGRKNKPDLFTLFLISFPLVVTLFGNSCVGKMARLGPIRQRWARRPNGIADFRNTPHFELKRISTIQHAFGRNLSRSSYYPFVPSRPMWLLKGLGEQAVHDSSRARPEGHAVLHLLPNLSLHPRAPRWNRPSATWERDCHRKNADKACNCRRVPTDRVLCEKYQYGGHGRAFNT